MKIKHLIITATIALLCVGGILALTGCGSTPAGATYQAEKTTVTTVDAAMRLWGDYVAQYHPSVDKELKVKAAFEKYQAAALVAIDAGAVLATLTNTNGIPAPPGAQTKYNAAIAEAAGSLNDLLAVLRSFGVKL